MTDFHQKKLILYFYGGNNWNIVLVETKIVIMDNGHYGGKWKPL